MPRRPTERARIAKAELRKMATRKSDPRQPLPASRELGQRWQLNHSTVFRILVELAQEGVVWQHPNGRFFSAASREKARHDLPVVFIGRQIRQWSHLYQEILEGVSEVCAARGCALIFLSSDRLVEHDNPETPPRFASLQIQNDEIQRLHAMLPRPYSGVIYDHLWLDHALRRVLHPEASHVLLLRPSELSHAKTALPDYSAGAMMTLRHMVECGYEEVQLAIPFAHDPATDQHIKAFAEHFSLAGGRMKWRTPRDCDTPQKRTLLVKTMRRCRRRVALLVPEDNIAILLHKELEEQGIDLPSGVGIISLQGTTGPSSPLTRVRYDYRRLGRSVAGALLGAGRKEPPISPSLIAGRTTSAEILPAENKGHPRIF